MKSKKVLAEVQETSLPKKYTFGSKQNFSNSNPPSKDIEQSKETTSKRIVGLWNFKSPIHFSTYDSTLIYYGIQVSKFPSKYRQSKKWKASTIIVNTENDLETSTSLSKVQVLKKKK